MVNLIIRTVPVFYRGSAVGSHGMTQDDAKILLAMFIIFNIIGIISLAYTIYDFYTNKFSYKSLLDAIYFNKYDLIALINVFLIIVDVSVILILLSIQLSKYL